MNNTAIVIIATSLLLASACSDSRHRNGNGHTTTRKRNVGEFSQLRVNGVFPVTLTQNGSEPSVTIVADENLQDLVEVKNQNGVLNISTKKNPSIGKSEKFKVLINIGKVHQIDFKAVGELKSEGLLTFDSLEVNSESVGNLNLELNTGFLRANLKSVGRSQFSGTAKEVRINNKSIGALNTYNLKADVLMIHNTAMGIAEVYAEKEIYIRSSSVGALHYKGPAQIKELSVEGLGEVKHIE
mgnify:CR=1 FL=1